MADGARQTAPGEPAWRARLETGHPGTPAPGTSQSCQDYSASQVFAWDTCDRRLWSILADYMPDYMPALLPHRATLMFHLAFGLGKLSCHLPLGLRITPM